MQLIKIAGLEARKVLSQEFYSMIKEELQLPIDYANWAYYLSQCWDTHLETIILGHFSEYYYDSELVYICRHISRTSVGLEQKLYETDKPAVTPIGLLILHLYVIATAHGFLPDNSVTNVSGSADTLLPQMKNDHRVVPAVYIFPYEINNRPQAE